MLTFPAQSRWLKRSWNEGLKNIQKYNRETKSFGMNISEDEKITTKDNMAATKIQQINYKMPWSPMMLLFICLFTWASSHQAMELLCFGPLDEVCQPDGYSSL